MANEQHHPCPHCGLTFKNGERTFRTSGHPVVTLEQHVARHKKEAARAANLAAAMAAHNALPLVEGHQPIEDGPNPFALCDARSRQAEDETWMRLPVLTPSRTTMASPPIEGLPAPTRGELIAHAETYGPEGIEGIAAYHGIDLEVSPLGEYRKERLSLEKRYRDSPTLSARLTKLSRSWLAKVRREIALEIMSGVLTVPEVAAEFGVKERTVRGWCSA